MFTLDDILTPLALTVIVDTKVRDTELNEFMRQAKGLVELYKLGDTTDETILDWYKQNSPILSEQLNTRKRNTVILRALTRFSDDALRENVYDAMLAISISDKEYAAEESDLVKSTAALWGFVRPPFSVDR